MPDSNTAGDSRGDNCDEIQVGFSSTSLHLSQKVMMNPPPKIPAPADAGAGIETVDTNVVYCGMITRPLTTQLVSVPPPSENSRSSVPSLTVAVNVLSPH